MGQTRAGLTLPGNLSKADNRCFSSEELSDLLGNLRPVDRSSPERTNSAANVCSDGFWKRRTMRVTHVRVKVQHAYMNARLCCCSRIGNNHLSRTVAKVLQRSYTLVIR